MAVALVACTGARDTPPESAPSLIPGLPVGAPSVLLYLDGTTLKAFDLQSREQARVADLPSANVALSPDGARFVAVEETHPAGPGPEGFRDPRLVIASTSAEETPRELGAGRAPIWNASSTAIAAIAPSDSGESIVVHNLQDGVAETAARGETWSLVGWSGEDVVALASRSGVVRVPSDGNELTKLRIAPAALWGVSPVGDTFIAVTDDGATLVGSEGRVPIGVVDYTLGDGAWSWDGATIAVTLLGRPRQRLVLIDAATGQVRQVAAGPGVQGNVVWATDNKTFAFVRVDPDARTRLQAVVCTSRIDCNAAFSWGRGVRLLGFG